MCVASIGRKCGGNPGEVGASHGAEAGKAEVLIVNGPLIVKVCWGERLYGTLDQAIGHYRRYTKGSLRRCFPECRVPRPHRSCPTRHPAGPPTATLEPATQLFLANHRQYWPQPRILDGGTLIDLTIVSHPDRLGDRIRRSYQAIVSKVR